MSRNTTNTQQNDVLSSSWWTEQRVKAAGLAGIIGGLGLALLSISRIGLGIDPGSLSMVYPLGYVLLAVALIAGYTQYGPSYGSSGRTIAVLLALSLMSYAGLITVMGVTAGLFGNPLTALSGFIGVAFFAMRLFGSLYGVILWRQTTSSRITAGLFVAILPAVFVLGPLALIGFPAVGIEAPLYLAFVAFGYELLTAGETSSEKRDKVGA